MDPLRILFVNAVNPHVEAQNRYPALGLGYLIAMVRREFGDRIEPRLVVSGVDRAIRGWRPHLMAISSVSQNYKLARAYAEVGRQAGIPVIVGGYHISELPQSLTKAMDVGVIGEGEQTFCELVSLYFERGGLPASRLSAVDGIVFWDGDERVLTKPRQVVGEAIRSLDELPIPDRSLMRVRRHTNMLTSRGCPYKCAFCASTRFWPAIRYFSPSHMLDEAKQLRDRYGVRFITFHDDLFLANIKRLEQFAELVLREGLPRQGVRFSCSSTATRITDDTARLLEEMNFVSVFLGLESGNQGVLERLKGPAFSVEANEEAIRTLRRHRIHAHAAFIIGEPQETLEQMEDTYQFIRRNPLSLVGVTLLTPLPGTPVWHAAKARGLVSDDMDWDLLNASFELDWKRVIVVSETVSREDLYRMYRKLRRLRLVKYAKAVLNHPMQRDLAEYGRAKIVEYGYRLGSTLHPGSREIDREARSRAC